MHIAIIGGVERSETIYRAIAEAAGHTLAFHAGHISGRSTTALTEMVRKSDLVVIVTSVNSHGAVQFARKAARKLGVPVLLQHQLGTTRFATLVAAIELRAAS